MAKKKEGTGDEYIRQREQAAAKLKEQGHSPEAARRLAGQNLAAQAEGTQTTVADVQAKKQDIKTELTKTNAFNVQEPSKLDLTPTFTPDVPIGGATASGILAALGSNKNIKEIQQNKQEKGAKINVLGEAGSTGQEAFPAVNIENARQLALTRISQQAYDKGISNAETFGAMVESIPIAGSLVSRYASGLIETPSANADNVKSNIVGMREEATNLIEKTNKHYIQPLQALERANRMEEDLASLKGRLKLLVNTSSILRANSDELNKMQQEIYRTEEMIAALKQASAYAYTAELSGTYQAPTEEQLYLQLQNA